MNHSTHAVVLAMFVVVTGCGETPRGTSQIDSVGAPIYNFGTLARPGACMDAQGPGRTNGTQIQEWSCNGTDAQSFALQNAADGGFNLVNASVNKCVDISGAGTANGTKVQLWDCNGTGAQSFWKKPAQNGLVSFVNTKSGKCLDVAGNNPADGTKIQLWDCNGTNAQLWNPAAVGVVGGAQPTRLRIINNCSQPIWVSHGTVQTDPQNIRLDRGQSYDYHIPDQGLSAVRFWPKLGCDGGGHNCSIGDNGEGGGVPCPASGCQPPIDSKFEVTFAARGSSAQTWYNLSQVDGYTIPFKVEPIGSGANAGSCVASDCSNLSLDGCPGGDNLSEGGAFGQFGSVDLHVRDLRGNVVGCMAPCKKLNYPAPWGFGLPESSDPALHMCCPTPIDPSTGQCTGAHGCMSSQSCSNAADPRSVVHTGYVAALRTMCPSAYSYAYDDANGLHACSSTTAFEVTFCPRG